MSDNTVIVTREGVEHVLRVPTAEQLWSATIDAAMAIGMLQGHAAWLEQERPDAADIYETLRDTARDLQRFIDIVRIDEAP